MLQGKVALVTGSARGLGRAYALRLAKLGADVVINDVNLKSAEEFKERLTAPTVMDEVEKIGRRSIGIQADVRNEADINGMFKRIMDEFGRLDILINNTGGRLCPGEGWASSVPPDDLRFIIDLNLIGTILCSQAASIPMKQQKSGNIINVSSVGGLQVGRTGRAADYVVAKAGVRHYSRLLAAELGPYGIRVNCIAPGYIASSRVVAQDQALEELAKGFPLGRLGRPEDCANVIEFLVSDLSGYITGECITIDGGYSLTHVWPAKS
ncbi:MAG: SDR family oxidoreductase [Candidatus Bathyarchaeia archaeon]|jgi:NAD(P)-dependent dehydrogenase (short-subunit alcohol dehydrogenase family)